MSFWCGDTESVTHGIAFGSLRRKRGKENDASITSITIFLFSPSFPHFQAAFQTGTLCSPAGIARFLRNREVIGIFCSFIRAETQRESMRGKTNVNIVEKINIHETNEEVPRVEVCPINERKGVQGKSQVCYCI